MQKFKKEFCVCKYNKKDGTIEYKTNIRNKNIFKKNKCIFILIAITINLIIINLIYIYCFAVNLVKIKLK